MCGKHQQPRTRHGFLQDHAIAEIPHCNQGWHPEKTKKGPILSFPYISLQDTGVVF